MSPDFCLACGNYSEDRDEEAFIIGTNPIIYCSLCHIGVHMKCVGLEAVPLSLPGGDPSDLHCYFCPNLYGYLYQCAAPSPGTAEKPVFAHLHCYLFLAGSAIRSFCPLVLQAPQVSVVYKGIYQDPSAFLVPYSVPFVRSEPPARSQARSLVTRSVTNAERRTASDAPPRLDAMATQNVAATLIFNNTKTEFVPAEIAPTQLFTDYQSVHLNGLEDAYNANRRLNNRPTDRSSFSLLPHLQKSRLAVASKRLRPLPSPSPACPACSAPSAASRWDSRSAARSPAVRTPSTLPASGTSAASSPSTPPSSTSGRAFRRTSASSAWSTSPYAGCSLIG